MLGIQHVCAGRELFGRSGESRGVPLPLYSINVDQLPDQYDSFGNSLLNLVATVRSSRRVTCANTFGAVSAQYNLRRLIQLAIRLSF
jgi:hypothetical protein